MILKEIKAADITAAVRDLCISSNCNLNKDVLDKINEALDTEEISHAKEILQMIIENQEIARQSQLPICQDTGIAVVFVELGQDVHIIGGNLKDAINEGVRIGYKEGYLRKSVVADPLMDRVNTGDNTPAIIHVEVVEGDKIRIVVCPKGAGSENMSSLAMLKPADGVEGVKRFVLDTVKKAGANPCPPIIVGVGIGGNFEYAPYLAKKALTRPIDIRHPVYGWLEEQLLREINKLGIGPQGLGGSTTALAVNIEVYPTHIAQLPVAVNISCHVTRHREVVL
ncbi:fumarate hydratase subunit alpha [Caldanaerobius fijiensis DSM 17918]|uniref:Fumarate hydratase subunit alpha n=1 Tax=Caldanaerobius fijiensis DSM 17918 TaxID=1121256 RepID=A0A1M4X4J6_9THEO|nr:fumarate hydratase subunit alpha [Caldanaerobius fijiensis DSM 17918]